MKTELEFPLPHFDYGQPAWPWSLNAERNRHWSWRNSRTKAWRNRAMYEWQAQKPDWPKHQPAHVTVYLPVKGRRHRDPANFYPAVKAIIDGLVLAKVWPDDNAAYVTVAEPVLIPVAKPLEEPVVVELRKRNE